MSATTIHGGNSNHVVKVETTSGASFAVRLSRQGPDRFVIEQAVMDAVADTVPVPLVRFAGDVPGTPGTAAMVLDWVDAPTVAVSPGDAAGRRAVARSLADVLVAVHSVEVTGFGNLDSRLCGIEGDFAEWFVEGATDRIRAWSDAIASYTSHDADLPHRALALLAAQAHVFGAPPATLAHGDTSPSNLLVDGAAIVAVLDWEGAKGGPPALDLGWLRFVDPRRLIDLDELMRLYASSTGGDIDQLQRACRLVELRILATMPEWQARAGQSASHPRHRSAHRRGRRCAGVRSHAVVVEVAQIDGRLART